MGLMVRTSFGGVTLPSHLPSLSNLGLWRADGMITTLTLVPMVKIVGITPKLFGRTQGGLDVLGLFAMMGLVFLLLATMIQLETTLDKDPTSWK